MLEKEILLQLVQGCNIFQGILTRLIDSIPSIPE